MRVIPLSFYGVVISNFEQDYRQIAGAQHIKFECQENLIAFCEDDFSYRLPVFVDTICFFMGNLRCIFACMKR